jgi:cytochrome c peroxidase
MKRPALALLIAAAALALAGFIRSPLWPEELTPVPAHALYHAVLGAAQIMAAFLLIWRPSRHAMWLGAALAALSLAVTLLTALLAVPFTNAHLAFPPALGLASLADAVALLALAFALARAASRPALTSILAGALAGGLVWGGALLAAPALPALAHTTADQFARYDGSTADAAGYAWDLPAGFPVPYVPADNPMSAEKVELGRYLFYDARLSRDGSMACAACHHQELAFSDGMTVPVGVTGEAHPRNAQSLTNTAYNATFTWGNPVLTEVEHQVVIPMFGEFPVEMGITGHEDEVLARLQADPMYRDLFAAAYPEQDAPVTFHNAVLALSSFVRALISGDAPYDRYVYGGDRTALSDSALRGMDLFLSERFECHHCHGGFNFTLSTRHAGSTFAERPFFNTGLYNVDGAGAYPRGNTGAHEITGEPADMGAFRPPSLRNVALTAPYMHDGSIATLEEVIATYAAGGRLIEEGANAGDGRANPHKSGFVPGFSITALEQADLLAFLNSLTDETFIANPAFSDPFE